MKGRKLTAIEKQRIDRAFESVPYAKFLGIEMVGVDRGQAVMRILPRDDLRRNRGVLHGGATASLIDTAAAFAIMSVVSPGQTTSTVDLTVHYLRPILTGYVTAHARVVRTGRRIVIAAVDVFDDEKDLLATAVTTYIRVK
jgi:uncharacterized protein (TIGR00369 family)